METRISFLFIFLFSTYLSGQTYDEYIKSAYQHYKDGNYSKSLYEYKKAFKENNGKSIDYYNAACASALNMDTISALRFLTFSVNKGWRKLDHLINDEDLISLHTTRAWKKIIKKVEKNLFEYEKKLDKPLKIKLENIYIRDQTLRLLYNDAINKFGKKSKEIDYLWSLISREDSINTQSVIKILEEKGWVGISNVGEKANSAIWIVVQHAPIEIQEKYLPLLKNSVSLGESKGKHLALLVDRILMRKGMPQIYGSQIKTNKNGVNYVYEIENPEYVNKRRKEVGLGPIENYVTRWGIKWNIEQK